MGQIGILNVGAGDTKLTFDKNNPAECIRSGRIVQDMLRRGYALLVEVDDGKGGKAFTRVKEFDAAKNEYIIADFDPLQAARADEAEDEQVGEGKAAADQAGAEPRGQEPAPKGKRGPKTRAIQATESVGIAIARSAGG